MAAANASMTSRVRKLASRAPPLIGVTSTPLRDPRYLKIVQDMESFGPASVQQAEAKIRTELAAGVGAPPTRKGAH